MGARDSEATARERLNEAERYAVDVPGEQYPVVIALCAIGRALLAVAEAIDRAQPGG